MSPSTHWNFTRHDDSALSLKKCSDSINVPSFILLSAPPFSRKPISLLYYCCCALYCFPLHEHLSWSYSRPLPPIANGRLSPDRSLMMLHWSPRRKWLLSGWQSSFLPLPGAGVHQCFPALGRNLLEGIFCTTFPYTEGWCAGAKS